jgi:predicted nucleic acid-binding protein
MATFAVVLDACVLIPRYVRAILLDAAERDLYRPVWSTRLLNEVEDNLVEGNLMTKENAKRLRCNLEFYFEDAIADAPLQLELTMTNDPKDRHVLATAVHEGATVIVTENLRDFPAHALSPHGVEAKGVDEFLVDLYHLSPGTLQTIVEDMAARYTNPPLHFLELTAILGNFAPNFAKLVAAPETKNA